MSPKAPTTEFIDTEIWHISIDTGEPGIRVIDSIDLPGHYILQIQSGAGTASARISRIDYTTGRIFDGTEDITHLFNMLRWSRDGLVAHCQHQYHAPQATMPGICELCGHVVAP